MKLNEQLKKLAVPIESLKLDPKNARTHSKRNLDAIKASLEQFGQQKPIVVLGDGTVIAGNGTLTAALDLGWKKLAVVKFDDPAMARAYALADNRSAELGAWDIQVLMSELEQLPQDIDLMALALTKDDFNLGDAWASDMERLDGIKAEDDAGTVTFKVVCPIAMKEEVKELLAQTFADKDGISID